MAAHELDLDRQRALEHVPAAVRPAVAALWRLDAALAAVVAGGREPMIGRIKLAWWREALEKLDHAPPEAEPTLQAVAGELLPRGLTGRELSLLEEAWLLLLPGESLTDAELDTYAAARGGALFRHSARLLGEPLGEAMVRAGEGWALADLGRRRRADAHAALAAARGRFGPGLRWPRALRPLGMLAALARRDAERGFDRLEPPGIPPRVARMLRHRLTGR